MNKYKTSVGEVRPSQIMFTYGIGSIVDLPKLSVIVMGLEDWPKQQHYYRRIVEDRLLAIVRVKHPDVQNLLAPPYAPANNLTPDPFDSAARIGVPVASFPRWMVCPLCRLLAPVSSGLFELDENPYNPERTVFRHTSCSKKGKASKWPEAVPARFLVTCPSGHLDDFPWIDFVHRGNPCAKGSPLLRLREYGPTGEARDLEVHCDTCDESRRLSDAFGRDNIRNMPTCTGRRPHLRDFDPQPCEHNAHTIILGASNMWFPMVLSTIALPVDSGKLAQLIEDNWAILQNVEDAGQVKLLQSIGQLGGDLAEYQVDEIWNAVDERKSGDNGLAANHGQMPDIKEPEWKVFTNFDPTLNSSDFRLRPIKFKNTGAFANFEQIMLVERLREVQAMVGFTRLDAVGELTDPEHAIEIEPVPISRRSPTWVPASEVRGEGIFIQFNEDAIRKWERNSDVMNRESHFMEAHRKWRAMRGIEEPSSGFPGMRYVLLHSFSHALMRQLALESGYSAASLKERIYSRTGDKEGGPMAGILIYTAASDSEGTLGGLVNLGESESITRHIRQALEAAKLCASDPVCAEREPSIEGRTLHAAACHACLFAPETACERGNKYLDRSTIVQTIEYDTLAFFDMD